MTFTNELKLAKKLALKAGKIQIKKQNDTHNIEYKGTIDIVTEVDKECEKLIVNGINKIFPNDDIMAEEGSGKRKTTKRKWIIDPIDGTVNFSRGFPFYCVSIALEDNGTLVVGVIYDPTRDEMFSAQKGMGAFMNDKPIRVTNTSNLKEAMLATGFAYNVHESQQDNLDNFAKFIKRARAIRRPGSAALDLAYVACGRFDGFWELFLKPWDIAAGELIVREAGGKTTDFKGQPLDIYGVEILATNGKLHAEMQGVLVGGK